MNKKDKTPEECIKFWNALRTKIENNEYQVGKGEKGDIQFGNYTDKEKIEYCNKMIYSIENPKVYS